jgi:hypothetical protein
MSSSESDYKPPDGDARSGDDASNSRSRQPSPSQSASRKRRRESRSETTQPALDAKDHLQRRYNDGYRVLFNENVDNAATRFEIDHAFRPPRSQIGTSTWSSEEKSVFFAALQKLGNKDIPGISKAIGTKSIPEVQALCLLLQDAAAKPGVTKPTLLDVPAAIEISAECSARLDSAGDALAWYQERFEAKQERERYGDYWLITPAIAQELSEAANLSRQPSLASTPSAEPVEAQSSELQNANPESEILQQIPEAELLNPSGLLNLSSLFFMNGSPNSPSSSPHWSALTSPLASEPSIYRTAFKDIHTLVVSLTQRLVQVSIIQATSRIRSQGWRVKKGVLPFLKKRDVHTAVDILNLQRDGKERWRSVARRCGLTVLEGIEKESRQMDWDEVEEVLSQRRRRSEPLSSGDEQARGLSSSVEETDFKARAKRTGTPLPERNTAPLDSDVEDDSALKYSADESDADEEESDMDSVSSLNNSSKRSTQPESNRLDVEDFDNDASKVEEDRLWNMLGIASTTKPAPSLGMKGKQDELSDDETDASLMRGDDWRKWTQYHAEWEEFEVPAREDMFKANQKLEHPIAKPASRSHDTDTAEGSQPSSGDELDGEPSRKRRKTRETELPMRGARAYAALQDRQLASENHEPDDIASEDDAKFPTFAHEDSTFHEDVSDMDEKPRQSIE